MPNIPEDVFTEPEGFSSDTLANLGPLRRLAGVWESDQGVDINPKADGPERRVFREHIRMEPIDPQGKPAVHATPLNHIGLWIDDLPRAVQWLTAQGVRFAPGGIRAGAAGHDVCFVHPKSNAQFPYAGEGVLIELVQAPPAVISVLGAGAS